MQMVIASRLTDGRVVFLSPSHGWVESIDEGATAESAEAAAALLEAAERAVGAARVVDPYLIDVSDDGAKRRPSVLREAIRAFGPSVSGAGDSDRS